MKNLALSLKTFILCDLPLKPDTIHVVPGKREASIQLAFTEPTDQPLIKAKQAAQALLLTGAFKKQPLTVSSGAISKDGVKLNFIWDEGQPFKDVCDAARLKAEGTALLISYTEGESAGEHLKAVNEAAKGPREGRRYGDVVSNILEDAKQKVSTSKKKSPSEIGPFISDDLKQNRLVPKKKSLGDIPDRAQIDPEQNTVTWHFTR